MAFGAAWSRYWRLQKVPHRRGTATVCNGLPLCLSASGSGSVIGRDPLPPRAMSAVSLQQEVKDSPPPAITLTSEGSPQDHSAPISLGRKASPCHPALDSPSSAGPDPTEGQGKRVSVLPSNEEVSLYPAYADVWGEVTELVSRSLECMWLWQCLQRPFAKIVFLLFGLKRPDKAMLSVDYILLKHR
jgi:hypothetical protein